MFVMWLGEQIDEFGIGNGISLLIMAGILARMPGAMSTCFGRLFKDGCELGGSPGKIGVETPDRADRAVRRRRGRRGVHHARASGRFPRKAPSTSAAAACIGGNRQYLPLRLNQSGVMPIIFASSLLHVAGDVLRTARLHGAIPSGRFWRQRLELGSIGRHVQPRHLVYLQRRATSLLIYFFCYFWMAITFNPKEMAENLKDFGSFIPGYRPGRRTAEYLEKVMIRITYVGAAFLALVAIVPTIISALDGRRAERGQLLRRHGPVDRRQRGLRPDARRSTATW